MNVYAIILVAILANLVVIKIDKAVGLGVFFVVCFGIFALNSLGVINLF